MCEMKKLFRKTTFILHILLSFFLLPVYAKFRLYLNIAIRIFTIVSVVQPVLVAVASVAEPYAVATAVGAVHGLLLLHYASAL